MTVILMSYSYLNLLDTGLLSCSYGYQLDTGKCTEKAEPVGGGMGVPCMNTHVWSLLYALNFITPKITFHSNQTLLNFVFVAACIVNMSCIL